MWRQLNGGAQVSITVTELTTEADLANHKQQVTEIERARFKKLPFLIFGLGPCIAAIAIIILCTMWQDELECDDLMLADTGKVRLAQFLDPTPELQERAEKCHDYQGYAPAHARS